MARTVRDARLDTRNARLRLEPRHEPYWRTIDQGMHLGYRKGERKASWLARYRPEGRGYIKKVLGCADDVQDADGVDILSFSQAQEKARAWFGDRGRIASGVGSGQRRGPYRVRHVMEDYLAWFAVHRRGIQQVGSVVKAHIEPELGNLDTAKLTPGRIRAFHEKLASMPPRKRAPEGEAPRYFAPPKTKEEIRRRRVTANKSLNILKAALNRAFEEDKIASDNAWRRVKPFREVNQAKIQFLTQEQCRALVKACDKDFKPLVRAAILTGCRYGELTNMRVGDVDLVEDAGTVWVATSKSGKGRHVVLTDEGRTFFKWMIMNRPRDSLIFVRGDGLPWKKSHQHRRLKDACLRAGIEPSASFHILRHTHASLLAMNDTPLYVIARQLGHADARMAEKHYAHLTPNYVAETIRRGFPRIGIGRVVQGG